jgi:hypothetical protein
MSKKPTKPAKLRPDVAEIAYRTMLEATGQSPKTPPPGEREKNADAVERGRAGGERGGKARADRLTRSERSESARKAALARWKERKPE